LRRNFGNSYHELGAKEMLLLAADQQVRRTAKLVLEDLQAARVVDGSEAHFAGGQPHGADNEWFSRFVPVNPSQLILSQTNGPRVQFSPGTE
jgi:hypothetical protein